MLGRLQRVVPVCGWMPVMVLQHADALHTTACMCVKLVGQLSKPAAGSCNTQHSFSTVSLLMYKLNLVNGSTRFMKASHTIPSVCTL
jgi:hypothetical protein